MRIGINLLYLIPNVVGGTQTYAESLIEALLKIDQDNEYFVFLNRECSELEIAKAPNCTRIVCNVRAEKRLRRYAWEQLILPLKIRDYRLDLIHSLGYVGPLWTPCPSIVTIPDLNYVALRDLIPLQRRFALHFFSTRAARRSAHVITISNFSKTEIIRLIGVRADKVTVTHLGPGWINDQSDSPQNGEITSAYGLPARYVVAFGGRVPHKNIPQLLKAFRKLDSSLPHSLVLLGHMPPNVDAEWLKNDPQSSQRIICLGYVPREHIHPILAQADLYVLPSLYEGFGMPALEAQSCGVPMACAASASLPEVAGDGAIFFDPRSVDEMAGAMNRVLSDPGLQASLRERGERNVERFSWENTARSTLAVYQEVLSRFNPASAASNHDVGAAANA